MRFSDIKGNESVVQVLRNMADGARVPHALLFYENPGAGGLAIATAFLQYLNCAHPVNGDSCGECPSCRQIAKLVHPDVHYVFPVNSGDVIKSDHPVSDMAIKEFRELFAENPYFNEQELYAALGIDSKSGNISVFEAKEILSKLSLSAVTDGYKAILMYLPERMNIASANKLLKILEEPPSKTIFILVTQNPEEVMSTIYSRCQGIRIIPFDRSQLVASVVSEDITNEWNRLLRAIMDKKLLAALDCADSISQWSNREKQKSFCVYASEQLRKIFLYSRHLEDIAYADASDDTFIREASTVLSSKFCMRAITNIDKAAHLIGRNVSSKMVFTDLVNRMYVNL